MGKTVSAAEAAYLIHRSEKTIRVWIDRGLLPASPDGLRKKKPGTGPNRWKIDLDDLGKLPGVVIDQTRLPGGPGKPTRTEGPDLSDLVRKLTRLERDNQTLRDRIDILEDQVSALIVPLPPTPTPTPVRSPVLPDPDRPRIQKLNTMGQVRTFLLSHQVDPELLRTWTDLPMTTKDRLLKIVLGRGASLSKCQDQDCPCQSMSF